MSLKELLDINELVFGVNKPKFRLFNNRYNANPPATSSGYQMGYIVEYNYENFFIYKRGFFKAFFILKVLSGGSTVYINFGAVCRDYFSFIDVVTLYKVISPAATILGISLYACVSEDLSSSATNTNIMDSNNVKAYTYLQKFPVFEYTKVLSRYLLIVYDQTKIMKI